MLRNPTTDLIVLLVIVLLFLGPKRLPGIGRGLGQGMREFKDGITGASKHEDEENPPPTITRSSVMPDAAAGPGPERSATPGSGSAEAGPDHRP